MSSMSGIWSVLRFVVITKQCKDVSNQGGTACERPWLSDAELDEARFSFNDTRSVGSATSFVVLTA